MAQERVLRSATRPKPTLTKELLDVLYPLPEEKSQAPRGNKNKRKKKDSMGGPGGPAPLVSMTL